MKFGLLSRDSAPEVLRSTYGRLERQKSLELDPPWAFYVFFEVHGGVPARRSTPARRTHCFQRQNIFNIYIKEESDFVAFSSTLTPAKQKQERISITIIAHHHHHHRRPLPLSGGTTRACTFVLRVSTKVYYTHTICTLDNKLETLKQRQRQHCCWGYCRKACFRRCNQRYFVLCTYRSRPPSVPISLLSHSPTYIHTNLAISPLNNSLLLFVVCLIEPGGLSFKLVGERVESTRASLERLDSTANVLPSFKRSVHGTWSARTDLSF